MKRQLVFDLEKTDSGQNVGWYKESAVAALKQSFMDSVAFLTQLTEDQESAIKLYTYQPSSIPGPDGDSYDS